MPGWFVQPSLAEDNGLAKLFIQSNRVTGSLFSKVATKRGAWETPPTLGFPAMRE